MQQALTSSVVRGVGVGGLLLAASLSLAHSSARHAHREVRLVLDTVAEPDAIYLSWWRDGDVRLELEPGELPPLVFTSAALVEDGCEWKGIEMLEPLDARHYAYRYDERLVSCRPGAEPYRKTPRIGIVTVED